KSNGSCKFDVVALVIPGNHTAPTLLWDYNTDLFSQETASAMLRHFLALVAGSIANPELPVAALPMLSPEECERLAAGAGRPARPRRSAHRGGLCRGRRRPGRCPGCHLPTGAAYLPGTQPASGGDGSAALRRGLPAQRGGGVFPATRTAGAGRHAGDPEM